MAGPGQRFSAELMDGQSAALRPVTVRLDIGGVEVRDAATDASIHFWSFGGLRVQVLGGGVLHVEHASAPGATLTSRDPALVTALPAAAGTPVHTGPRGRRLARQIAFFGAALVALVTAIYFALPAVSQSLARRVPMDVEARMGVQFESFFGKSFCHDQAAEAALQKMTARLGAAGLDGARADRVDVVDWKHTNAFTLPGGKVLITQGLIDDAESADELAGVLAHELEHVRQRHIMAQIIRGSILSLGWAVTVGDFSGLFVVDPSTAFAIANQRFSREAERQADAGALARLDAAGIPRAGFAAFFRRIQKDTDMVPAWLSTHPASKERIDLIGAGAPTKAAAPVLSSEEWQAIKNACTRRATK